METEVINNEAVADIAECTQHTGDIGLGQCALIVGGIALAVGAVKVGRKYWAAYKKRHGIRLVDEEKVPVEEDPEA